MKYGLSEKQLKEIVQVISEQPEIEEAVLFGSRVIDTFKEASDVDIALKGPLVTAGLAAKLKFKMEEDTYLPFFFDFIAYPTITSEELKKHIKKKGKVIYRRIIDASTGSATNGELKIENDLRGWKNCKLGQLTTKIGSGATPRGGSNSYKDDGVSLIRSQNVLDLQFSLKGLAFIDETQADALRNVTVKSNDILLNITGDSVARACKVPDNILPARVNQHVAIIRTYYEKLIPNFLLYYLISQKEELLSQSEIGATRRAITKGMVEQFQISLPPLPEQRAIASVLSSLDDKIDLLHRQNKTLETMAETLFRQWFVPFDSAQGTNKASWKKGYLEDVATHFKKSIKPEKNPIVKYFHYSIPAFDNGKRAIIELGNDIKSNKYEVPKNCILFSKLNSHKDKRVWLLQDEVLVNSICSTEFQVIYPKEPEYLYFIYGWLTLNDNYREIASEVGGTSGNHQRISPSEIFDFRTIIYSKKLIKQYNVQAEPLYKKQLNNQSQICTLEKLRDTLLPKLISGKVRVASTSSATDPKQAQPPIQKAQPLIQNRLSNKTSH